MMILCSFILGGCGPDSDSPPVVIDDEQTVATEPQSMNAIGGNTLVSLSWEAPSSNGNSPITTYAIHRSKGADGTGNAGTIVRFFKNSRLICFPTPNLLPLG